MHKASLGTSVKLTTFFVIGLLSLLGLMLMSFFFISLLNNEFEKKNIMMPIITLALFAIIYYAFSERILGYELTNEGIKIFKKNNSEFIKKESIIEIKPIDYKDIRFSIRTFGIGGIFSLSGSFKNKKYGEMTWYITRKDQLLMIVTSKQQYVISPDESELFLEKTLESLK